MFHFSCSLFPCSFYSIVFSFQPVIYDFVPSFHIVFMWRNSYGFHSKLFLEVDFFFLFRIVFHYPCGMLFLIGNRLFFPTANFSSYQEISLELVESNDRDVQIASGFIPCPSGRIAFSELQFLLWYLLGTQLVPVCKADMGTSFTSYCPLHALLPRFFPPHFYQYCFGACTSQGASLQGLPLLSAPLIFGSYKL